jgi:hypothetical protein
MQGIKVSREDIFGLSKMPTIKSIPSTERIVGLRILSKYAVWTIKEVNDAYLEKLLEFQAYPVLMDEHTAV